MALELGRIAEQVEEIGRDLAEGAQRLRRALPALRALRSLYAHQGERLRTLASSAAGREMACALPTHEPLDAIFPAPEPPPRATILATDGSQIYPDPHGMVLYYLINIGGLVYRHGSGQAPWAASVPQVGRAVDAAGDLVTADQIDARRDVAELRMLADLAEAEAAAGEGVPLVALLDSTLGLRAWSAAIPQAEQGALRQSYIAQGERLQRAGAALAGFLSRSRRAGTVHLLDLAQQAETGGLRTGPSPFLGLNDALLWGDLRPGERSALLVEPDEPPIYFFYLNPEPPGGPTLPGVEAEPARVELPEWVACNPERLGWVHALVYDQCRLNNGYPYVLSRADELAIILNEEREALERMLWQVLGRHGLPLPRPSPKERQKRVVRAPFRRR